MKNIFGKIREKVKEVPKGKVTTYGEVAKGLGIEDARQVGWALHGNKNREVPCHRVVKKGGFLAKGYAFGGWREQKERLAEEGVSFVGEAQVDMKKCFFKF